MGRGTFAGERSAIAPDSRRFLEALGREGAGQRARRAGDYATARHEFETAIDLLSRDHRSIRSSLRVQLSRVLMLLGDSTASLEEARAAVADARHQDPAVMSRARGRLAVTLTRAGRPAEAVSMAEKAIGNALEAADEQALGYAQMASASALRASGHLSEAVTAFESSARLAGESEDWEAQVARLIDLADALELSGHTRAALAAARRSLAVARRWRVSRGMACATAAHFEFISGRWQSAQRHVDEGTSADAGSAWLHLMAARLLVARGEFASARQRLRLAAAATDGPRAGGWDGPQETLAELALCEGRPTDALGLVREGLAASELPELGTRILGLRLLGLRAAADVIIGGAGGLNDARSHAGTLVDDQRATVRMVRSNGEAADGLLRAVEALSEAEYARSCLIPRPDLWALAAASFGSIERPWDAAYAQFRLGEAMLSAEAPAVKMVDPVRECYEQAVRLGAVPLQRAAEALAARAQVSLASRQVPVRLAASTPREPRGLTPREQEVLELIARGSSNRRIAHALGISEKTVSVHVGNINAKLGVANRLEAAAAAMRVRSTDAMA